MSRFGQSLPQPPLLLITDRKQARSPLTEVVAAALAAGCRWISLREKDLSEEAQLALCHELAPLAARHGALLSLHGSAQLAQRAGLAAVHLPSRGDLLAARATLGPEALIGCSCHDASELETAARQGADYATLSPLFESRSKPGYGPALGLDAFSHLVRHAALPVLALGGIDVLSAASCLAAGASGLAVMGAVMAAPDPGTAMAALIASMASA